MVSLLVSHHLTVPVDRRTLIDVLGTDGGPVCADPSAALTKTLGDLELSSAATTVGARPLRAARRVVNGEELVVAVYCPHKLAAVRDYLDAKSYYGVIRGSGDRRDGRSSPAAARAAQRGESRRGSVRLAPAV